ncbi:MAG: amidohydrolase [Planctomycetes bacterium]|nr:amidohydrolase [Planctomycetota bacterium]
MKNPLLLLAIAFLPFLPAHYLLGQDDAPQQPADLVVLNAKIWTVNKDQPEAEALAVVRDRIVFVGSTAAAKKLVGPKTRVLDLDGKRVVPGFHDSHLHFLPAGMRLSQVALKDAPDEAEFGRRLRDFDKKLPKDAWMLGGDWDHDRALNGVLPTAELIDKYVPDRPVFMRRYDGHMAIVNTKVLKMAGIDERTPDPTGGVVFRKPGTKIPTGLLRDRAMGLVDNLVPRPSNEEIALALRASLEEARRYGVTSVQDMDGSDSVTRNTMLRMLQAMARTGQLTVRIRVYFPLGAYASLAQIGIEVGFGDLWVSIGSLKDFIDGSLGSTTAMMFEPYENEPTSSGIFVTPVGRLRERVLAADKAGLGVAVHAIGDRGNAELLDIFAESIEKNGKRDRRFRVEHAQHLRPQDYKRFAELGVIASMQPYHAIDDGRWAEGRIGKKRCASSYAFRSLLDAGAKLAFGTDWMVAPLDPLLGIDAAVNRRTLDGKHPQGWFPEQKITVAEALECYTLTSAYAAFLEKDLGTLEKGKLADFVVLSRDILAPAERDRITDTRVLTTVVGGRVVYDAKK